jgi:hypothetical protein
LYNEKLVGKLSKLKVGIKENKAILLVEGGMGREERIWPK